MGSTLNWFLTELRRLLGIDLLTAGAEIDAEIERVKDPMNTPEPWRHVSVEIAREVHDQALRGYENILDRVQALLAVLTIVLIAPPIFFIQLNAVELIRRLDSWPWEATTLTVGYFGFLSLQMTLVFVAMRRVVRQIPAKMVFYPDIPEEVVGGTLRKTLFRSLILTMLEAVEPPSPQDQARGVEYMRCSTLNGLQVVAINNHLSSSLQLLSDCLWCLVPTAVSYAGLVLLNEVLLR